MYPVFCTLCVTWCRRVSDADLLCTYWSTGSQCDPGDRISLGRDTKESGSTRLPFMIFNFDNGLVRCRLCARLIQQYTVVNILLHWQYTGSVLYVTIQDSSSSCQTFICTCACICISECLWDSLIRMLRLTVYVSLTFYACIGAGLLLRFRETSLCIDTDVMKAINTWMLSSKPIVKLWNELPRSTSSSNLTNFNVTVKDAIFSIER